MKKLYLLISLLFISYFVGFAQLNPGSCKASFLIYPDASGTGYTFAYNSQTISNTTTFLWNFGDGKTDRLSKVFHSYAKAGTYVVTLIVADPIAKCIDSTSQKVVVGSTSTSCIVDFSGQGVNLDYYFTSKGATNSSNYYWDFGDNTNSNIATAKHTYKVAGNYNVCLTVKDSVTGCQKQVCKTFTIGTVNNNCKANYHFSVDTMKNNVTFVDSSYGKNLRYYWSFNDGTYDTQKIVVHNYAKAGAYNVCLTVYDSLYTCKSQICKNVQIGSTQTQVCKADFNYFVSTASTNEIYFSDQSSSMINSLMKLNYYWDLGDGNFSTTNRPVVKYLKPGNYNVCLYIKDSTKNCQSQVCKTIIIGTNVITPKFTTLVDMPTLTVLFSNLTASATGKGLKYYWDFGDGTFAYDLSPKHKFLKAGTYQVCLTVKDSINGTANQYCEKINLGNNLCQADFSYFVDLATNSVSLKNISLGNASNVYWDFGNGITSALREPAFKSVKAGSYNVCLYIKDSSSNCFSQICKTIMIGAIKTNCEAKFTAFVDSTTKAVTITDLSNGNISKRYWDYGDGNFSTIKSPVIKYVKPGTYNICLGVYDSITGCISKACNPVNIGSNICIAKISSVVDPLKNNVMLSNTSVGNVTSYYWDFGDGQTSTTNTINHQYIKPGSYNVCLYTFDSLRKCQSKQCNTVIIGQPGTNVCTAKFTSFIDPNTNTVKFNDASSANINKYYWYFGDGSTSTMKDPKHQYAKPGTYHVILAAYDTASRCANKHYEVIQVGVIPCKASFNSYTDIKTNKVILTNTSVGRIQKFFWQFEDGTVSYMKDPIVALKQAGTFKVCLTVNDSTGKCMNQICDKINVGTIKCKANFTAYIDSVNLHGKFINQTLTASSSIIFNWNFGDGSTSNMPNPDHKYKVPGIYNVTLKVYDKALSCMDEFKQQIVVRNIHKVCNADFIYQLDSAKNIVKFTETANVTSSKPLKYFWFYGDKNTFDTVVNPTHQFATTGKYNVCLSVYDKSNQCYKTKCENILVGTVKPNVCLTFAHFTYFVDSTTRTVTFKEISRGNPTTWAWDFGDGTTSNLQHPTHTYAKNGYYKVHLRIRNKTTNACFNDFVALVNVNQPAGIKGQFSYRIDSTFKKSNVTTVDFYGATFGDPSKFIWEFGDSQPNDSVTLNPSHVYTNTGSFNVCLTVAEPNDSQSDKYCQSLVIPTSINENNAEGIISLNNYPNPATNFTNIVYSLPTTSNIEISVYNILGSKISTLVEEKQTSGTYFYGLNCENLNSGLYYIKLKTGDKTVTHKMSIVR